MFAVGWSYSSLSLPYKDADRLVMVGYVIVPQTGATAASGLRVRPPGLSGDIQPFFDWKERKDVFTCNSRRLFQLQSEESVVN
jgi:hypothetical protein